MMSYCVINLGRLSVIVLNEEESDAIITLTG